MMPCEKSEVMLSIFLDALLRIRVSINGNTEVESKAFALTRNS